jgi:hypothetical protein
MAGVNYVRLAELALRLIRDNGRNVTFIRNSRTAADSNKPWRGVDTAHKSSVTVRAVVVPYTQFEIDGTLIRNGDKRAYVAYDAFLAAAVAADTAAGDVLTLIGQPTDGQTVTINAKVYTFQDTLTDVNGHVQIGADAETSLDNLVAAINLGSGASTLYAATTTLHPTVSAVDGTGLTVALTAKTVGDAGNLLTLATNITGATAASATFTGGLTVNRTLEFYDLMRESDNAEFRIMSVGLINPAGTAILYDLHMRQ